MSPPYAPSACYVFHAGFFDSEMVGDVFLGNVGSPSADHVISSQKTGFFIATAVTTLNPKERSFYVLVSRLEGFINVM
jgi:hypothetical protein